MGGLKDGKRASRLVVEELHKEMSRANEMSTISIQEAFRRSHESLCNYSKERHGYCCMGATATMVKFDLSDVWIANVGDTRALS